MNKLLEIENLYLNKLIDIKYLKVVNLLEELSDENYLKILEENSELMDPISEKDGDNYVHNLDVLDKLDELFTTTLRKLLLDPKYMDRDHLTDYICDFVQEASDMDLLIVANVIYGILNK